MPCQGSLNRDASCLEIANFTDHDNIGILAQDRAQRHREIKTDLRLNLDLVDAGKLVLDRIFHGE